MGTREQRHHLPTAVSVLAYLEEVDYQNNEGWKLWPGLGERYAGQEPHGVLLTTYLNPAAYDALTGKRAVCPTTPSSSRRTTCREGSRR